MGTHSIKVFNIWVFIVKGVVALTILKNETLPKRREGLKISCLTSPTEFIGNLTNTWIYPSKTSATTCLADMYVCTGSTMNYRFTADNNGAYATIYSLDRIRDSGTWTCIGSDNLGANNIVIDIYSSPVGLSIVSPPPTAVDLAESSVTLECKTDSCCYPEPTLIAWYYQTNSGPALLNIGTTRRINNTGNCTQQEKMFSIIIELSRGTSFIGNIPMITLLCGIVHPVFDIIQFSGNSISVKFVVYVSSVTLIPGNSSITFLEGDQMIIKCVTSPSRPHPHIRWWVGDEIKTDNITESISNSGNLVIMESEIFLMLNRSYRNRLLYCDTQVPEQGTWISSFKSQINVWFAPEMSVKVTPSIAEVNSEVHIECSVHGEPSSYKFYDWIHKLGNNEVRHIKGILVNQSTLGISFPSITTADMGTYICFTSNGITGPDGGIVQSVEAQVNIIGVPVAFVSDAAFIGEINMSASIRIPFISNPSITDLKFFKTRNNAPVANDTGTHFYHTEANISTIFYNTGIVLQGMEAVLVFRSLKESDFGQYTLVLYNSKGTASLIVHLKELDPHTDTSVGPSIAGIAGGIGGGVVVIVVTGVVMFLWRRHNHTNKAADGTACVPTAENYEALQTKNNEGSLYQELTGTACVPTAENYEALQAKNNEGSLYQELSDIKSCADTENSFRRNETQTTENPPTYINTKETVFFPQEQGNV